MDVSHTNSIAVLWCGHAASHLFNDSNALVPQNVTGVEIVKVCATQARVRNPNEYFRRLQGSSCLVGQDLAVLGATEYVKSDAHFEK